MPTPALVEDDDDKPVKLGASWVNFAALEKANACLGGVELPATPDVQSYVREGGSALTYLGVALRIVDRFVRDAEKQAAREELQYVRSCLMLGHEVSQRKVKRDGGSSQTDSTTDSPAIGRQDTPSTLDLTSRGALSFASKATEPKACPWMGPALNQWPAQPSDRNISRLQVLLGETFSSWHFDIFELLDKSDSRPLVFTGWQALRYSGCFSEFALDAERCQNFMCRVEPLYGTSPRITFHNNLHAADVTQSVHSLLTEFDMNRYLDPMDRFVLVLGAIIHDVAHDGRTNIFHINMQDELALRYNDRSVLENFHLSTTFNLMADNDDANLMHGLTPDQARILRTELIDAVLGTDMAVSPARVKEFVAIASENLRDIEKWRANSKAMYSLRSFVLHAADISNQAKPFSIAVNWATRLFEELFQQGDEEFALGQAISPMCDRRTVKVPEAEIYFLEFITAPTFSPLLLISPKVNELATHEIQINIKVWKEKYGAAGRDYGALGRISLPMMAPDPAKVSVKATAA
eukprot:TRINITY_DN72737_c0_g1_i1.p1 TRINITY_DN72737_c0_g1~~TRINITY_DN72737_c0_g1_i1.p1  ORF type:complete len:522 (-),score=94.94 TRINITY_DN72737_c0_g1_i1:19-1584(-)